MTTLNITGAAESGLRARITAVLDLVSERHARYRLYRRTVNELSQLSNRDLADLGIHRSSIRAIATEAAYGK